MNYPTYIDPYEQMILDALLPVIKEIVQQAEIDLLHPEFGSIWRAGGIIDQQRQEAVEEYKRSMTSQKKPWTSEGERLRLERDYLDGLGE